MATRTIAPGGGNFNATGTWVEGIVPVAGDDVVATAASGNLTVNAASGGVGLLSFNMTSYTGLLTMNNTLTISGNMTLVATMTIAGSSNIICNATATLTSGGKVLPGLSLAGTARTYTLADNFQVGAFINTSATTSVTLNGNTLSVSGNMIISRTLAGTTNIVYNTSTTQTINITGAGTCSLPTQTFNAAGTITISGYSASGGTLTYTAGTMLFATDSILYLVTGATTLDTSGMTWNSVWFQNTVTHTLLSDLNVKAQLALGTGTNTVTINGSTINASGGVATSGTTAIITGTTKIKMLGGTMYGASTTQLRLPLEIAGDVTIWNLTIFRYNTGTLTYTSGKVTTTGSTLAISLATTLINMDKIAWNIVTVTPGVTLTMNKFFSGSPKQKTTIQSATSGTAYTITFQDTFEKIAKFVKVSDCSLTRKGQLLMLTPNSDKGGNSGIRYINQSPNGIAKNSPTVAEPITYPAAGLVTDPCFISL